jgi:hypothetical protein
VQKAIVLCFHSGNERDYQILPETLRTLHDKRFTIVPLITVAQCLVQQRLHQLPERTACLTVDDGLITDFEDVNHPVRGHQPSFATIMHEHETWLAQRKASAFIHATSFVIASRDARQGIEQHELLGYPWMTDAWWPRAVASGRFHIANHSLDHVSPSAPSVAQSQNIRADFSAVNTEADACAQIIQARAVIESIAPNPGSLLFAYPYGHRNAFLTHTFLPRFTDQVLAAFTTDPGEIHSATSRYEVPRFVCGETWSHPNELPLNS